MNIKKMESEILESIKNQLENDIKRGFFSSDDTDIDIFESYMDLVEGEGIKEFYRLRDSDIESEGDQFHASFDIIYGSFISTVKEKGIILR